MTNTKAKLEFVWAMARHTKATVRQCEALMRYAATLQRLAEDDCNIPMDDVQRARWEVKRGIIQHRVLDVCHCIDIDNGVRPVFSGDPRGAVLKIQVRSGYSNDFGGEGICVPS